MLYINDYINKLCFYKLCHDWDSLKCFEADLVVRLVSPLLLPVPLPIEGGEDRQWFPVAETQQLQNTFADVGSEVYNPFLERDVPVLVSVHAALQLAGEMPRDRSYQFEDVTVEMIDLSVLQILVVIFVVVFEFPVKHSVYVSRGEFCQRKWH